MNEEDELSKQIYICYSSSTHNCISKERIMQNIDNTFYEDVNGDRKVRTVDDVLYFTAHLL